MKKLLVLILALLLLCSCSVQEEPVIEEPQSEAEISASEKPEVIPDIPEEPVIEENGNEEDVLPNGAILIGNFGEKRIYALEVSKITKQHRFYNEDGKQYLAEAERKLYKIFDSDGNEIIPHPVESFDLFVPGSMGNEGENHLYCVYENNLYIYDEEKDFELIEINEKGFTGEILNGFEETFCYWEAFYPYVRGKGLSRPDGSVFLEPIYQRIEAPFTDRFLAKYGVVSQAVECIATDIIDLEGNVLSDCFNTVNYYFLDDGSYIGVGRYYGGELTCRDENGNEYEKGNWFIDKDGNKISENFAELYVAYSGHGESFKLGTTINVTTAEGKEMVLPIETYAIKP